MEQDLVRRPDVQQVAEQAGVVKIELGALDPSFK
jgi:hypothetical protein